MVDLLHCPDAGDYERSLRGELDAEQVWQLAEHLRNCESCAGLYAQIHRENTLARLLAESSEPAPDSILDGLISRLAGLTASASNDETAASESSATDGFERWRECLAPAENADEIGRLGGYRVLAFVGQGGMGVVLRAEDLRLKRLVALKLMRPDRDVTESARARFLREAQKMAAIEHENIVPIYQAGEDRGVLFLAMPFLQGEGLDGKLKREGRLATEETLRLGREMAEGLSVLHENGLVHRDLKPSNVFLARSARPGNSAEQIKILDFGLARERGDATVTQSGEIVGTPAFMAPEQGRGETVDARADLFSLGCILYCMCTGKSAFVAPDAISTLLAVAQHQPAAPSEAHGDVPAALSDLIMRLLEKDRDRRPVSAREVADALQSISEAGSPNESAQIAELTECETVRPQPRKRRPLSPLFFSPRVAAAAAGLFVVVLGTVGAFFVLPSLLPNGSQRNGPFFEPGDPLHKLALVRHPAKIKGVTSWTIETVYPRDSIGWVAFSPDGKYLATVSGKTMRIWNATNGKLHSVVYSVSLANYCSWSPDGKLIAFHAQAKAGPVWFWNVETGRKLADYIPKKMHYLTWSPDGKRLAGGGGAGVRIFNRSGKPLQTLRVKWKGNVTKHEMAWSPDGKWLIITGDGQVQVWDSISGKKQRELETTKGAIWNIAFSPNGKRVAANVDDKSVCLWDFATGKIIPNEAHPTPRIGAVAWLPDNKTLAFAGAHWDAATGKRLRGGKIKLPVVAYSPDGKTAVTLADRGGYPRHLQLWDVETAKVQWEKTVLPKFGPPAWSPNGKLLSSYAQGTSGGRLLVLDGKHGDMLRSLNAGSGIHPKWSTDSSLLAGGTGFWEWNSGKFFKFDQKGLLRLSGDFKRFVLGRDVYDTESEKLLYTLKTTEKFWSVAWSPDSKRIATAGEKTQFWNAANGKLLKTIDAGINRADGNIAWSPDDTHLSIANKIFDTTTYQLARTLNAELPFHVTWSPDGKVLSMYKELWNAETGKPLGRSLEWGVRPTWSPDGKSAACSIYMGCIAVNDTVTGKVRAVIVPLGESKVITVSGDGHYRGATGVEDEIRYVVKSNGVLKTLAAERFRNEYGWKNDPNKVRLIP